MALSILGRRYESRLSSSIDHKTGAITKSHSVVYIVQSTDCVNDEAELLEVTGIPELGSESDIFPGLLVSSIDWEEGEGDGLYFANVEYNTPDFGDSSSDPGGGGGGAPPWDTPVRVSYDTTKKPQLKTKMVYLGAFQNEVPAALEPTTFQWTRPESKYEDEWGNIVIDVTNSAGEPIYYDGERSLVVAKLEFSVLPEAMVYWLERVNTVNRNIVFLTNEYPINAPGKLYLDSFTSDRKIYTFPSGIRQAYYECSARVVIDPYGHWVEFADIGTRYFDPFRAPDDSVSDSKIALDADSEPTQIELNGRGGPRAAYEGTFFLKYVPYPVRVW